VSVATLKGDGLLAQNNFDTVLLQLVNYPITQPPVHRAHHFVRGFDERRVQSARAQRFGHFKTDITRADDDRSTRALRVDELEQSSPVAQLAHDEDAREFVAGERRADGQRARRQHEIRKSEIARLSVCAHAHN
jgi:hypothetical protein